MTTDSIPEGDEPPDIDFTPLQQMVVDSHGKLVLDFSMNVGARPYITYDDGAWTGVKVGPFDETEDGKTVMTTEEIELDGDRVHELLDSSLLVQLRTRTNTPIEDYEDWVYEGLGEEGVPLAEYEPAEDIELEDSDDN